MNKFPKISLLPMIMVLGISNAFAEDDVTRDARNEAAREASEASQHEKAEADISARLDSGNSIDAADAYGDAQEHVGNDVGSGDDTSRDSDSDSDSE